MILQNYMIYDGLKKYGYPDVAKQLASRLIRCVSAQLSKDHDFREFYDPDMDSASGQMNYFPDAIMAKLLYEDNVK